MKKPKHRVKQHKGWFYPQYRWWLFWCDFKEYTSYGKLETIRFLNLRSAINHLDKHTAVEKMRCLRGLKTVYHEYHETP